MCTTRIIMVSLTLAVLAACESPQPSKEGSGVPASAYAGTRAGRNMDRGDWEQATHALDTSADGQSASWRNHATGLKYSVTPTRSYREDSGGRCRDFAAVAQIDGRDEVVHGTACKQPGGAWKPR